MERGQKRRAGVVATAIAFVFGVLVVHDAAVPAQRSWSAGAALSAIASYRTHVSPHLRGVVHCRFQPTCSAYGCESVSKYGLLRGGTRTAWRILRCGPWTPMGTSDPP